MTIARAAEQQDSSAVNEFYKLKNRIEFLSDEELERWNNYSYYMKHRQEFKKCNKCNKILPLKEFYKNPLKKQGVFDYCKACAILMDMARRKKKKEREEAKVKVFSIMKRGLAL